MSFRPRHVVSINDFSTDEILYILKKIEEDKKASKEGRAAKDILEGHYTNAFYESSTRTDQSFKFAAQELGLKPSGFSNKKGTSDDKNERLEHGVIRMFDEYGTKLIVLRHYLEGSARAMAEVIDKRYNGIAENKPWLMNAGDGSHEHPTQTFLDLFTIYENKGKLDGLTVGFFGDLKYSRVANSLALAHSRFPNNKYYFISPDELKMKENYKSILRKKGIYFVEAKEILEVINELDVLCCLRTQLERIKDENEKNKIIKAIQLRKKHVKEAKKDLIIMHPLPINKRHPEIHPELESDPRCVFYQQAGNGKYARRVLIRLNLDPDYRQDFEGESFNGNKVYDEHFLEEMELKPSKKRTKNLIYQLKRGTVIDNIKPGKAVLINQLLNVPEGVTTLIAEYLPSPSQRVKGMIKYVDYFLTKEQKKRVAIASSRSRISEIDDYDVIKKDNALLPERIDGVIECSNENCFTKPKHDEYVLSSFILEDRENEILRCRYCDTLINLDDVIFITE